MLRASSTPNKSNIKFYNEGILETPGPKFEDLLTIMRCYGGLITRVGLSLLRSQPVSYTVA